MKSLFLLCCFLLSNVSLAATNCDKREPVAPSIPNQDLSKREQRQLDRDMLRFLRGSGRYIRCIRSEYRAEAANDAPEPQLQDLVAANNTFVKEVDELVAIYEERIGPIDPIREKLASQRRGSNPRGSVNTSGNVNPLWEGLRRQWLQQDIRRAENSSQN